MHKSSVTSREHGLGHGNAAQDGYDKVDFCAVDTHDLFSPDFRKNSPQHQIGRTNTDGRTNASKSNRFCSWLPQTKSGTKPGTGAGRTYHTRPFRPSHSAARPILARLAPTAMKKKLQMGENFPQHAPGTDGPVQAPCQGVNAKHQAHAEDLSYGNGGGFPIYRISSGRKDAPPNKLIMLIEGYGRFLPVISLFRPGRFKKLTSLTKAAPAENVAESQGNAQKNNPVSRSQTGPEAKRRPAGREARDRRWKVPIASTKPAPAQSRIPPPPHLYFLPRNANYSSHAPQKKTRDKKLKLEKTVRTVESELNFVQINHKNHI